MEVCVIAKCTYKSETIMFSVSSESSMVDILKTLCLRSKRASAKPLLSNEWKTYIHHVGQKFDGGAEEFRLKLCKYALEVGFNFLYADNDKKRVVAICSNKKLEGCSWRVYASRCEATGCFVIRTLNNVHTCAGWTRESKSKMMRSRVVSSLIVDRIHISYYHAWFGKELAKLNVHGDESKSFNELVWYADVVNETNPGSLCTLECEAGINRIRRFFVSFGSCIAGFQYCIPLLFIDATFLKSKYKGQLLCASGKNGNQGFYPLAFGVVDSKTEENLTWFLQHLAFILLPMGRLVTFFSDRNQGLLNAMRFVFPGWPHTYCYYHLKQNLISKYPKSGYGKLLQDRVINLFSRCAYAVTEEEFTVAMEELVIVGSSKVKTFISDLSRDHYANAYFKGMRYGEMANSLSESFNN
ncbi:unnamed protein product [Prunus armeniaca]